LNPHLTFFIVPFVRLRDRGHALFQIDRRRVMFLENQAAVFDLPARWSGKIRSATSSRTPTCVTLAWLYCRDDAQRYSFGVGKLSSDEARRTSRHHQGTMDLRTGASAVERKTRTWSLRGTILARSSSSRIDHDRLRLPATSSPHTSGRKKESTDRRLSLACRPCATPSSISFFDHYLSNAHTAEDEAVKNSGVGKSAKVVLGSRLN